MRVLLAAGDGARERGIADDLARGLAAAGCDARVLAGARGAGEPRLEHAGTCRVLVRTDPAPSHWQRTRSSSAAGLVRALLREERTDLLHVLAWRGLTRDLVAVAADAGVPAVVTISDPWLGCLVGDRVRRDTGAHCAEPLGPMPCLACAELAHGPTPWVPVEARFLAVAERRRDGLRELERSRRVIVADAAAAEAVRRSLGSDLGRVAFAFVADPRDAAAHAALYQQASAGEPPARKEPGWWEERMQVEAERAWDEARRRASEASL